MVQNRAQKEDQEEDGKSVKLEGDKIFITNAGILVPQIRTQKLGF